MKPRTLPHPSIFPNEVIDYGFIGNPVMTHHGFKEYRTVVSGWYQWRQCQNGIKFRIRAFTPVEEWHWVEWLRLEKLLDECIALALRSVPEPWYNSEYLDCEKLMFHELIMYGEGKFSIGFGGEFTEKYHESFDANFEEYQLIGVEWSS